MLQFAYTLKRKFAKERGSKMATNKQEVMQQMEDCLKKHKRVEFSFILDEEIYICISIDVFGSGQPEFIVLGNSNGCRKSMNISNDMMENREAIHRLFDAFPEQLDMMIIPDDREEEEINEV